MPLPHDRQTLSASLQSLVRVHPPPSSLPKEQLHGPSTRPGFDSVGFFVASLQPSLRSSLTGTHTLDPPWGTPMRRLPLLLRVMPAMSMPVVPMFMLSLLSVEFGLLLHLFGRFSPCACVVIIAECWPARFIRSGCH